MKRTGKYPASQMSLVMAGEWDKDSLAVEGADVFCSRSGKVSKQWLSGCSEERVLTQDLITKISELPNLAAALRQVVKNRGSAGADGMSVKELREWFSKSHRSLSESLNTCTYQPEVVKGVEIPKPKGGYRQLGIPTVKDRLVQQAISQGLSKRYEPIFSTHSYGFRPGRSAHDALETAGNYVAEGYSYVIDLDLEKFFDTVNHDRLIWLLGTRMGDKTLLKLIGKFLRSGILKGGLTSQRVQGTPQGSPLSPLLSNIVLDELDKELEFRGHRFVRYADDLIIMVKSAEAAKRVKESITDYIETRLRLKVNREKSRICRPHELNFLGHAILSDGSFGLSRESEQRFKAKIKQLTRRNRGISLDQLVKELTPQLRGWLNYFRYARMQKRLAKIASWLRRRIRCFRLKQCKRAIGIVRFLRKLGVSEWRCWLLALSGKGWYRKSNTPQAHEGMNLDWFVQIGLYNLEQNYCLKLKESAQYDKRTLGAVRGQ